MASEQSPVSDNPRTHGARYVGRFAPSPTGLLHLGSLVAAVGSYLAARSVGGEWLLRIEDLDPPREVSGSTDQIMRMLATLGFEWAGPAMRQSARNDAYRAAATQLLDQGLAYPCSCSRAELLSAQLRAPAESEELHYPGWCRHGVRHPDRDCALRLRAPDAEITFVDQLQGKRSQLLARECGDFVIQRRDKLYAYQLAVVVDDAAQGVTHVVRGADLINSTPRQIILQRALGLPTPMYAHLPVVTDANAIKLSKSTGAAAVDIDRPAAELWRALRLLQQSPPPELRESTPKEVWNWATQHWRVQPLLGRRSVVIDDAT